MKDASQYSINFPYGATSAPYSAAHPHRGDDRACPTGTPVIINGVTIGLTGATGNVTGPHLHIQEWHTNYADTRKPQNAFAPGTVTNIDPSGTQGDGSFGKFITIKTADGWSDTYCHLSQINVKVGQVIGDTMEKIQKVHEIECCRMVSRDPNAEPGKDYNYPFATGGENGQGLPMNSQNISAMHSFWFTQIPAYPITTNVEPYSGPQLFVEKG